MYLIASILQLCKATDPRWPFINKQPGAKCDTSGAVGNIVVGTITYGLTTIE